MLSRDELDELELLLEANRIDHVRQNLNVVDDKKNKNFVLLYNSILNQEWALDENQNPILINGHAGCILEGSSRSGKTWSSIDIIIWLCLHIHPNGGANINIYRETFAEFTGTLYDDFKRRLDDYGLDNPFLRNNQVKRFKINGNTITFMGCDRIGKQHGAGADYVFFNEMMGIPKEVFDQAEMRCRRFWWGDYNPSATVHYVFENVITRDNVGFLRTTFLDNPHITPNEKNKILGYEPYEPGSYEVREDGMYYQGQLVSETNKPPINVFNERNGTIDTFMWTVYGLGLRGAIEGVIFRYVDYLDEWPEHIDSFIYPSDFGFTVDPHVTCKYNEDESNIYIEPLSYYPIENPEDVSILWENNNIPRYGVPLPCDSSDKHVSETRGTIEMVSELRDELGWSECYKISKRKSVMYWLLSMKKKKIHIIKNKFYAQAKKEQENYKMKSINGIQINQPIDKFNHIWDCARYGHMAYNSMAEITTEWN